MMPITRVLTQIIMGPVDQLYSQIKKLIDRPVKSNKDRIIWFVALWVMGVIIIACFSYFIRWLMGL